VCKGNDGRVANDDIHGSRLIRDWRLFSPPTSVSTKLNAGTSSVGRFYYPGKSMPPTTADLSVSSSSSSPPSFYLLCKREKRMDDTFCDVFRGAGQPPVSQKPPTSKRYRVFTSSKRFSLSLYVFLFFFLFFSLLPKWFRRGVAHIHVAYLFIYLCMYGGTFITTTPLTRNCSHGNLLKRFLRWRGVQM
jgi:hypothetical protein